MFATSEEQLIMHNEGKKHKRTVALKELTQGHLHPPPADSTEDSDMAADTVGLPASGGHQQQNGPGQAETSKALFCAVCELAMPSKEHMQYHLV